MFWNYTTRPNECPTYINPLNHRAKSYHDVYFGVGAGVSICVEDVDDSTNITIVERRRNVSNASRRGDTPGTREGRDDAI